MTVIRITICRQTSPYGREPQNRFWFDPNCEPGKQKRDMSKLTFSGFLMFWFYNVNHFRVSVILCSYTDTFHPIFVQACTHVQRFPRHPVGQQPYFFYCSLVSQQLATSRKMMFVGPPSARVSCGRQIYGVCNYQRRPSVNEHNCLSVIV